MRFTKWFPAEVKPVYIGVYPTKFFCDGGYSMWNGAKWGSERDTVDGAREYTSYHYASQSKPWRGLAEKPE